MGMTKRTPLLLVSHLPSASSYYASLLQPLGLVFLFSSSPTATPSPHETLHFGYPTNSPTTQNTVLFSVAQSHEPTVRPASIYLETPSPQACVEFHRKAEKLNRGSGEKGSIEAKDRDPETGEEEVVESRCKDFDGNLVIARYSGSSSARNLGSVNAMDKEVRRVLEWQSDVARSAADSVSTVKAGGHPGPGSLRRSATEPAREPNYIHDLSAGGGGSNGPGGFSGKAILGTILGAAAGAAVAYAMVRSESPDPVPHHTVSYIPAPAAYTHRRSLVSEGQRSGVTANQENIRPRYVARYAIDEGGAPDAPTAVSKRELERIEERTYVSRPPRSSVSKSSRRSRSQGGESRHQHERPLTILPAPSASGRDEGRSHVSHRSKHDDSSHVSHRSRHDEGGSHVSHRSRKDHGEEGGSHVSRKSRKSSSSEVSERDGGRSHHSHRRSSHSNAGDDKSYHSARSTRTESTIKPPKSTTTIKLVSPSHAGSVRPSQVELPRSRVGEGSEFGGGREGGDYAESVCPSDSVSSVGVKRERERLRERMRTGGWSEGVRMGGERWGYNTNFEQVRM